MGCRPIPGKMLIAGASHLLLRWRLCLRRLALSRMRWLICCAAPFVAAPLTFVAPLVTPFHARGLG